MNSPSPPSNNQDETPNRNSSIDPIDYEGAIVPMEEGDHHDIDEEDLQMEREYGCKFCDKKFSNKQALGGHQNAHKIERSVEKTTRDMHENAIDFFTGGASSSSNPNPPILSTYQNTNNLLTRAYITWPYQQHFNVVRPPLMQMQMQMPVQMQMPEPNYGPRPPLFNNLWGQVATRLPFGPPNPNFMMNQGGGYVGFQAPPPQRPIYGLPRSLRLGPERPEVNFANLRGGADVDEAGLDLTLRL